MAKGFFGPLVGLSHAWGMADQLDAGDNKTTSLIIQQTFLDGSQAGGRSRMNVHKASEASAWLWDIVILYSVGQNKSQGRPQFRQEEGMPDPLKEGGEKSHCKECEYGEG